MLCFVPIKRASRDASHRREDAIPVPAPPISVSSIPEVLSSPAETPNMGEHLAFGALLVFSPARSMNITKKLFFSSNLVRMGACVSVCVCMFVFERSTPVPWPSMEVRRQSPCLTQGFLFLAAYEPGHHGYVHYHIRLYVSSGVQTRDHTSKHFTHWAISPAPESCLPPLSWRVCLGEVW